MGTNMQQHVKILAILNIIYGAMTALAGLVVMAVLGGIAGFLGASGDHDAAAGAGVLAIVGTVVPIFLVLLGAPSIIAGIGLLKYQSWARILTIIVSALHLLSIPFGTALGAYGLGHVKPEAEAMFAGRPQSWPAPTM